MTLGGVGLRALLLLAAVPGFAQTWLTFRPVDAAYSTALDRIILIAPSPNQLHIYDASSNTDQIVGLAATPLSLSVSPNSQFAAVGHDGSISHVNLNARTVDRTYTVSLTVRTVVAGTDWVYGFNPNSAQVVSVRLTTGAATTSVLAQAFAAKLHPTDPSIYYADYRYLQRFDVATGLVTATSPTYSISSTSQLWISPDGSRIYPNNGSILRFSTNRAVDMTQIGRFPDAPVGIAALGESAALGRIAVIPSPYTSAPAVQDDHICLYSVNGFQQTGRFQLSSFTVAGNTFAPHGKWVFFNNAGTAMHAISQADGSAGLLNDFAVQSYALSNAPPCFASFTATSVTAPFSGILGAAQITADPTCVYRASTSTSWLQIVAGGYGSGNGSLTFHARANTTNSTRSGTITMGSQTLTISQDAAPSTVSTVQRFSYKITNAEYSKALDRIVIVSASPDELHLYNPLTRSDQFMTLPYPPLSVSVRPDGLFAAVGHGGFLSHVNLQTMAVDRLIPIPGEPSDVVLAANGYAYYFAPQSGGLAYSVQISTGTVTVSSGDTGRRGRLQAPGNYIYSATDFTDFYVKLDIRQGVAQAVTTVSNVFVSSCGTFWLSEDGSRLFNSCGSVYRTSDIPQQDLLPSGTLAAAINRVAAGAHSSTRATTAILTGRTNSYYNPPESSEIQLYADDGLTLQGRLLLTRFSDATAFRNVQGKFVFWNSAASQLYAISQIDSSAGLLSDYLIETITPSTITGCAVTLPTTSADVSGSHSAITINVTAGNNCPWNASTSDNWISLQAPISGAGAGSFQAIIYANGGSTSRTGFISPTFAVEDI